MRLLILLIVLTHAFQAHSACRVLIPEREFHHSSGYSITFNFDKLLKEKNYTEVFDVRETDFILNVLGNETEGRFHKAVTSMEMGFIKAEASVTCLTQMCGIADFARSFNKVYKSFNKKFPVCQN